MEAKSLDGSKSKMDSLGPLFIGQKLGFKVSNQSQPLI